MKKQLLFLFAALLSIVASAQTKVEIEGIWYNLITKVKVAEVTFKGSSWDEYSNEYSGSITIPATVTYEGVNYSVTSIGYAAFGGCRSLTAITIPEGVTSIGESAFEGCRSLTAINIPESVTSIGELAFGGCSSLTTITIPESVTCIGDGAFADCSSLTTITIPENSQLTNIGDVAFYGCTGELIVNSNIPPYAFEGSAFTKVTIGDKVTSIGYAAFYGCSSLTTITIPESVTCIGDGAFYGCSNLTAITIPESVTSIGNQAFCDCSSLTAITIPESVTNIGSSAFEGCSSLTAINIPEGVTSIGNYAFDSCSSLTAVNIPASVTSIGNSAFRGCCSLRIVINCSSLAISKGSSNYGGIAYYAKNVVNKPESSALIDNFLFYTANGSHYLAAYVGYNTEIVLPQDYNGRSYQIADYAFYDNITTITISENVTNIGEYAFYACPYLTTIVVDKGNTKYDSRDGCNAIIQTRINQLIVGCSATIIPEDVTSIGKSAFYGCNNLTTIIIPESVTSIGSYAFYNCSSLTAINIPENSKLTSIGESAFRNCSSLTAINIPESVTSIGSSAFYGCTGELFVNCNITSAASIYDGAFYGSHFTKAIIGDKVTSIGGGTFRNCSSLTAITIPESVTSIGNSAFSGCSSLTAINIPESVTSIGESAFSNCSSLTAINIPEGVTTIGNSTFYDCYSLTAINIPESVTSIGNSAFSGCSSLTAITIPEGVTSIEYGAFRDCSSLTSIALPKNLKSIGSKAFFGCKGLTSITIPKGVENFGDKAFADCSELLDVYCYAEKVPSTKTDAFDGSYPEYATLHVPASALETYKTTSPWSNFGTIVSLTDEKVTSITLNHTEATLTEGETLTLTATIAPIYATDRTLTWSSSNTSVATVDNGKVTAIAPGTATITATANDGSGVKASCVLIVEETLYIKITINQYGSGTYSSEYALDFSEVEGLKAYAATGYNYSTKVVTLTRIYTSQPHMGIFIKGEPGTYEVPVMEVSTDNTMNMLVATLTQTPVNAYSPDGLYANYKYTIKEGDAEPKFYQFANGSTMGAGKAYLQIPTAWLPAGETRCIGLRFDEGEGTTDMEEFTIDNSQLTIIYDLQGRRVAQPVKGSLYIVNGRKVVY